MQRCQSCKGAETENGVLNQGTSWVKVICIRVFQQADIKGKDFSMNFQHILDFKVRKNSFFRAAPIKPDWIIWVVCVIKVFVESQTSSRLKSRPKLTFGIAL